MIVLAVLVYLVGQLAFNDPLVEASIEPASHFPIALYLRANPLEYIPTHDIVGSSVSVEKNERRSHWSSAKCVENSIVSVEKVP